jgi:amino acid adenylation domain-containing protein
MQTTTRTSAPHDLPAPAGRGPHTLNDLLRGRAERQSAQRAYTFLQDDGGEQSLTYGELDARARAVAASLRPVVPTGGRVLLLYPPGLEYVVAFFGCLYAGAVAVPAYPPRKNRSIFRLQAIVADAKASAALTTAPILARVSPLFAQNPYLEPLRWMTTDADAGEDEWQAPPVGGEDVAFLQYTSGSTGTPKGVMLTHRNLLHNAELVYRACSHTPDDSYVSWLPTFHDMGFMAGILQPLYGGFHVTSMSPAAFLQRPARWLQAITKYRATTSGGPNFAYDLCVRKVSEEERAGLDLSRWGVAFNGAEPIRPETLEAFAETFAPCGFRREAFYPCYGLAEATLMVTGSRREELPVVVKVGAKALEENRVEAAPADGASHTLVGCGHTLLGQRLEIVHPEELRRCGPGEVGEIWVSGGSVAAGYWNRPEETEHTFRAAIAGDDDGRHYLRTGDLGFVHGGELFVTGRLKDLVIIRGLNHYPQDIERTVEQCHESLRPGCGAAFSVEAAGEERLVIVQELHYHQRDGHEQIIADIREAVAEEHDVQVYAVVLIKHGTITKTSSGKIQRHACRAGFLERSLEAVAEWRGKAEATPGGEGAPAEPSDGAGSIESWLVAQSAARLRVDPSQIDVRQPLGRYGLDSLVAIELKHQVESRLGVVLPLAAFLESPSIAQLAAHAQAQLAAVGAQAPGQAQESSAEQGLSRGQQSLWFLHQLAPESTAYNLVSAMRVRTPLDDAAFARALQALAARHQSLRTTFHAVDGKPVQHVHAHLEGDFREVDASGWDEARLHDELFEEAHTPFDLAAGPLLRVRLYSGTPGGPVLLFTLHHIIVDLWSLSVLMHELGVLYEAEREGAPATLAPVALQYGDYVRWQEEMLAGPEGERLWAYWHGQLAGELPVLNLPTDRPRPAVQTYRGASHPFRIEEGLAARLKSLGHAQGATLYMTLLAAFQVLLHRYTGQRAVLVGSPTAGRNWAALAGAVGYFINPIVLRAGFDGDPTFETFLGGVRQTVIAALEHQDFPFSLLVERLQPERDPARSPLFQAMFGLHKAQTAYEEGLASFALGETGARMEVGGLLLESYGLRQRVAQFDLTLTVAELGGGLAASLEYNADLFDASTPERMAGHFVRLLEGVAEDPRRRLSRLPLLTEGERARLLYGLNDTRAPLPGECLPQLFERQAAETPEAVAVSAGAERLTYGELNRRANQLARRLRAHGAAPGSRVGVLLERTPEMLVGLLGALKAGAAYVPLDPSYPEARLSFMLEDSGAGVLLTEERLSKTLGASRVVRLDADRELIGREDDTDLNTSAVPEDLAYVIYTSGSTGRPKGVMVSHRALVNLLESMRREPGLGRGDVLLAVTTLSFDIAALELYLPLLCGARVELATRAEAVDAARLRRLIGSSGATVMQATPATWRMLIESGWEGKEPLKVLCGGEALPRDLADELCRRSESVWNMYGPTETTVWSLVERVGRGDGAVLIGRPIANTQVYILDERMEPVVEGVTGELYIGGAGLARGYAGRPALTAERFVPDPFGAAPGGRLYRTGDFARLRAGSTVECLGRGDQQVKVRGYRIELGEIEAVLRRHEAVADCVVVAREDGPGGARLAAYVVAAGARAPAEGEAEDASAAPMPAAFDDARRLAPRLRAHLREHLPEHMVPSVFVSLDSLPLTPNGKVDRRALPAPEQPRQEAASAFPAALKPSEELLAGVWQEVLGVEHVGLDDNFFELGGHSLLATQVVSRVRGMFGVELPLHTLFEAPTVRALAANIEGAVKSGLGMTVPPIRRAPRDRELPLSFAQQRLWFLDQLEPGSPFYNSPATLRLKGALDEGALRRALSEIVRRHEVLRTTFTSRNGRPAQVIRPAEEVALPLVDLTQMSAQERERAARELAAEEALRPFDLSTGPLLRVTLLRLAEDEHVALFTMHHIVCDGWSVGVLVRELSALYEAYVEGRESPLEELPVQYADYAVWQREWLRGGGLEKQLTYWRRQLGGRLPVLELPTDRPRPTVLSERGARLSFTLGRDLTDAVTALSRQEGATLFMTLLAAFQTLLGRYAKQRDVIVGAPVAGRNRAETEGLIGFFVNMLAMRADLSGNPPFKELLRRVREMALGAYVHQDLPFDKLVEELQPERDPTGTPIFRVAFGLDNVTAPPLALPGLTLSLLIHNDAAVRYDLTLWLEEVEGGLAASWTYRADLFDAPTVARMHGHFATLLGSIVAQPDARLGALEILTETEKQQKLTEARGLEESKGRSLSGARRKVTRPLS